MTKQDIKNIYINIDDAKKEIQKNPIIIVDNPDRENEGDLVCPVIKLTPEIINFMIKKCGGMICVTIDENQRSKFNLSVIEQRNANKNMAKFTVPIESRKNVTTGISAKDRYESIMTLTDEKSVFKDISVPGHIIPILINKDGLLVRKGHTEASASLSKISGLGINNVICEILDEKGNSARGESLYNFAKSHNLKIINVKDLYNYLKENNVKYNLW